LLLPLQQQKKFEAMKVPIHIFICAYGVSSTPIKKRRHPNAVHFWSIANNIYLMENAKKIVCALQIFFFSVEII
jgi:hypothetical protein